MSKNSIWKNFDHTYGPLPAKASEYLRLKQDLAKMQYNAKQKKMMDELIGDRGSTRTTEIKQKEYKMRVLETELCNNRYLYRNGDHMTVVMRYIFPQYVVEDEKPNTPEPVRPLEPIMAAMPAPIKVYHDAWY